MAVADKYFQPCRWGLFDKAGWQPVFKTGDWKISVWIGIPIDLAS